MATQIDINGTVRLPVSPSNQGGIGKKGTTGYIQPQVSIPSYTSNNPSYIPARFSAQGTFWGHTVGRF